MQTNGDILRAQADAMGLPLRTLAQVQADMEERKRFRQDPAKLARLQLKHGRLTDEARAWLAREYPL